MTSQFKRVIHPIYPNKTPAGRQDENQVVRQAFREMNARIWDEHRDADFHNDHSRMEEAVWRSRKAAETEAIFEEARNLNPVIFVSYTNTGENWLDEVVRMATRNKIIIVTDSKISGDASSGFIERFSSQERASLGTESDDIPSKVRHRILNSEAFLGIWTKNFEGQDVPSADRQNRTRPVSAGSFPGVWMPFEYGAAFTTEKPLRLLCERGLHPGYTDRLFLSKLVSVFNPTDASGTLQVIASALGQLCDEVGKQRDVR